MSVLYCLFRQVLFATILFVFYFPSVGKADITCSGATTLEALVACIRAAIPLEGSEGFQVPTIAEQSDWRKTVSLMLAGCCENEIDLPSSLSANYEISSFMDSGRSYCVLREVGDQNDDGKVDLGWGTFITALTPPVRELNIHISHPLADIGTDGEGIGIFKGTQSRSFLLAGTHRNSNVLASTCQPSFQEADAAHNVTTMFQPTVEELMSFYTVTNRELSVLQFHGKAQTACSGVNVYMTYGVSNSLFSQGELVILQNNLLSFNPTWLVKIPGDSPSCSLHGSDNVQGRLLNNVAPQQVYGTPASSPSENFFHIEQDPGVFRTATNWIAAINATWPLP